MGAWTFIDGNPPELSCSLAPSCIFCGGKMIMHEAVMYNIQLSGQCNPDPQSRAIDAILKCSECGYLECFGVALTQEEAKKIHG